MRKFLAFNLIFLLFPLTAAAEIKDPLAAGPNIYRIQFENEKTRVLDIRYRPGQKSEMHFHPDHLLYVIESSKIKEFFEDGHYSETKPTTGELSWVKEGTHSIENTGDTDYHAFLIEFKDAAKK